MITKTQILRSAEEILSTFSHFKRVVDSTPHILWLADEEGMTYFYNNRWYEVMGREEGHDKEFYFYDHILHPEDVDRARTLWQNCVRTRTPFSIEYRFLEPSTKEYRWILAQAETVINDSNEWIWHGTYVDIDQQIKRELELKKSISFLGHELRSPLTSLSLHFQLGKNTVTTGREFPRPMLEKFLDRGHRQIKRLTDLTESLLDASRSESGNFPLHLTDTDISAVIRETTQDMHSQLKSAGIFVQLDLEPGLCIQADSLRMSQVFYNLLSNVINYAPGSSLSIDSRFEGDGLRIHVTDSGPGIKKADQEKIFECFEQGSSSFSRKGLGIGLYLVKKIINAHQGSIQVQSELGKGSTFEIFLPRLNQL